MPKKVIVADDSAPVRDSLIAHLGRVCRMEGIDAEFDQAPDGAELVRMVLGGHYDLVFTDDQMPNVDGLSAISQILESKNAIPIYMISPKNVGEGAIGLGATGYFDKNGDADVFQRGVLEVLKKYLK